jgi:energy-coupling factor transporter ATP-binding protein EcfA2
VIERREGRIINKVTLKLAGSGSKIFNDSYQIQEFFKARYRVETFSPVLAEKVNDMIIVQENFKDSHAETLKEIDGLKQQLVAVLKDNEAYLKEAVTHMVAKRFGKWSDTTLTIGEKVAPFEPFLRPLVTLLREINPLLANYEALLQEAVIEANYQRFVGFTAGDSFSISEAMKLFSQSHEFTEKMKGQDLIFLIGNTGSGKSTYIAASVGCGLKKKKNGIGQQVYVLEPEKQEGCPRIGQSLTSSETLFSEGFPVKEREGLLLVDTPGLGENRARHFALCAALSIDQALRQAQSIKAFVVVIPLSTFLLDRGNGVIDLMKELHQVFPDILKEDTDSVHILVTKHPNYTEEDLRKLTYEFLKDEKSEDRKSIWRTLLSMANKGQMQLAVPNAKFPTKKLLEKYSGSRGLNPNQFRTLMDSGQMKHEFADYVQSAATTWTRGIFQRYLDFFAHEQANVQKIDELEQERIKAEEQLERVKTAIDKMQSPPSGENIEEEAGYQTCLKGIEGYQRQSDKAKKEIRELKQSLHNIKRALSNLSKKIDEHSSGRELDLLFENRQDPDYVGSICTLKSGAREQAHLEGRATTAEDCSSGSEEEMVFKDYTGDLAHSIEIDREYYLAPSDRSEQEAFEKQGIVQTSEGQYKAIVTGREYELDLQRRIHPSGKKIVYYFKTHWKAGQEFPWIKVEHEVPRIKYFAKSLADWYSEKGVLEAEQTSKKELLTDANQRKKEAQEKIEPEEKRCREEVVKALESQKEGFSAEASDLKEQIDRLKTRVELDKEERAMVAVTIKTHWNIAKSLSAFTKEVIEMEKHRRKTSTIQLKGNLLETCEGYQELFKEHQKQILERCEQDLGIPCDVTEIKVEGENFEFREEL